MNPRRGPVAGVLSLAKQHLVVLSCKWLIDSKYLYSMIIGCLAILIISGCNQANTPIRDSGDDQTETLTNDSSASETPYTVDTREEGNRDDQTETSTKDDDFAAVPPYTAKITLNEVDEIEIFMTDEAILSLPHTVHIDSKGNIFWAESSPPIYVFNSDGVFIGSIGAYGAGPGELRDIETFNIDSGGDFHVFDASISRISLFSSDFSFVRSYSITADRSSRAILNSQDHFVVLREAWYNGLKPALVIYDQNGKKVSSSGEIPISAKVQNNLSPGGGIAVDAEDNIYYSYISDHRIWKTDLTGEIIDVFDSRPSYYIAPDEGLLDQLEKRDSPSNPEVATERLRHFYSISRITGVYAVGERDIIFQEITTPEYDTGEREIRVNLEVWHSSGFKIGTVVSSSGNVSFIDESHIYYVNLRDGDENPSIVLYTYDILRDIASLQKH